MATKLWKDGKSEWFATESVGNALRAGWSTSNLSVEELEEIAAKELVEAKAAQELADKEKAEAVEAAKVAEAAKAGKKSDSKK